MDIEALIPAPTKTNKKKKNTSNVFHIRKKLIHQLATVTKNVPISSVFHVQVREKGISIH